LISPKHIIINIDGSSQGNPGPSGIGVHIESADKKKIMQISKYIGERTNNQAEYEAMLAALRLLKTKTTELNLAKNPEIVIKTDSELLYYQITGKYKVKDFSIKKLYTDAVKLMKALPKITMVLIPREENRICDRLAKKAIHEMIKSGQVARVSNKDKNRTLFS
jgi:ribonuclease HI